MRWLALMVLAACGGYGWQAPTRADVPATAAEQLVTRREMYLTAREIPQGWRRPDDPLVGPFYFLFSDQNYGCLVRPEDFTMARDRDLWLCEWRRYRP